MRPVRIVEVTEGSRERFNAAVASSPGADVLQSFEWGEVKRPSGWTPVRLLAEDDAGTARGACSVLRKRPAPGVPPLLYAPRGPVFADEQALRALIGAVRQRAGGAFMLKSDPPVELGSPEAAALARAGLRETRAGGFGGVQPVAVMVLDLDPDLDKIFEGLKPKWRYNVRLAERRGVVVREGARVDLGDVYALLVETARRDGFTVRGRAYFETLWDVLAPAGMLTMFVADHDGKPIAAIIVTAIGERVVYTYGASSSEHRDVMPNHLLQWSAIRWAKERGCRVYDFRGVSPVRNGRPVEPHIAGLNRFKEGFGARYVEYAGPFDLPLRRGWYAAWRYGAPLAVKALRRFRSEAED